MPPISMFEAFLYDATSIRVAEEIGPNSFDYDTLHDRYMEDRDWRFKVAMEFRKRRKKAANDPQFIAPLKVIEGVNG
jgi:hypothetical protein